MLHNPTYLEQVEESVHAPDVQIVCANLNNRIMAQLPPIVYADRGGRKMTLHLIIPERHENYLPKYTPVGAFCDIPYPTEPDGSRGRSFPLIVYVQGSGWGPQNVGFRIPLMSRIVRSGYAMAFVEYRPTEEARFPAQVSDVRDAVRFLRAHAAEYNLDADRIAIWGDSSGAHIAVMSAVMPDGEDMLFRGIIDCYGPMDIEHLDEHLAQMLLQATPLQEHLAEARAAAPMRYLRAGTLMPPVLILHGTKDRLVPLRHSEVLYNQLREIGAEVEFIAVQGGDHGRAEFWCDDVFDAIEARLARWLNMDFSDEWNGPYQDHS